MSIKLADAARFDKQLPHQINAWKYLEANIDPGILDVFADLYRTPLEPELGQHIHRPLAVPFQSQLDNISGQGTRECFSSSCAMVAMYWGKVKNDDEYCQLRQQFGDTTDAQAQLRTLHHLGLNAEFITTGTTTDLRTQIDRGRPTPVGWLHHGPVWAPTGGGHWSVVVDYGENGWLHNDPNGEAKLESGGYTDNLNGERIRYSDKNWNPRWIVEGEGSGWYLNIWPEE